MKKFLFFTKQELNKMIENMYYAKGESVTAEVSFCEKTEKDIVILKKSNESIEVYIDDIQGELSDYLDVEITYYDEMEVGDFGLGFLFFI